MEISRDTAVNIFMEFIINRAYKSVIKGITGRLENGPSGKEPPQEKIGQYEWFKNLDEEGKQKVHSIVRDTVESTLFGVFVILDGASGGYPIKGELSDFALYLQTYKNEKSYDTNLPKTYVRLNPSNQTEDLHDIFMWKLDELNSK